MWLLVALAFSTFSLPCLLFFLATFSAGSHECQVIMGEDVRGKYRAVKQLFSLLPTFLLVRPVVQHGFF